MSLVTCFSTVSNYLFVADVKCFVLILLSVSCLFHVHLVIMYSLCDNKYVKLNVSPYIILVHIIFSGLHGSLSSFIVILKIEFCISRC